MNTFNLTFWGEVLPGHDPEQVRVRFGKLFGIDDPERLEQFFSGQTITLRRNLDLKTAADYYSKMHKIGLAAELVKIAGRPAPPQPPAEPDGAAEEAARKKAEEQERKRRADEEAARLKTEQRKRETEEKARLEAEREEAVRLRREQKEAERRKAAQEVAARKAEEARRKRAAEEAARLQREKQQEEKRRAAEETARRKAEERERRRQAAEEAARKKAEEQERKRRAAEEAARRKAEQRKREAEEKARLKAERDQAARVKQEQLDTARRRAAEEAAARRAEEERRRKLAEEQRAKREAEQRAHRRAMEAQAIKRAADALADGPGLQPAKASAKTTLELPERKRGDTGRRRQAGEPNLYQLHAFRLTREVKSRTLRSRHLMRRAFNFAILALACLLILGGQYLEYTPPAPVTGPDTLAVGPRGELLILAGNQLMEHDRSGKGKATITPGDLGLQSFDQPLAVTPEGQLLLYGALKGDSEKQQLLRCDITPPTCSPPAQALDNVHASHISSHPLSTDIFLANIDAGELIKLDGKDNVTARAALPLSPHPVIRLDSGLLLITSADGPAISVYRYDDSAFGQQLDEILLLPPPAVENEQSRVRDFMRSGDTWWAILEHPDDADSAGLYRFDQQWNYLGQAELPLHFLPTGLLSWNNKLLVTDPRHTLIQRFNALGSREVPLESDLLLELTEQRQRDARLGALLWQSSLLISALLAMGCTLAGLFFRWRSMVYRTSRERGAVPIDDMADAIRWIEPSMKRGPKLKQLTLIFCGIAGTALLLAILLQVSTATLLALMLLLAGPAATLFLLHREPVGHLGLINDQVLLVDHRGTYHLGDSPRIQFRGAYLSIDDVVVFTGNRLLPTFEPEQVKEMIHPRRDRGVRVDSATIAVKLLEGRHAQALGVLISLAGSFCALALLLTSHL